MFEGASPSFGIISKRSKMGPKYLLSKQNGRFTIPSRFVHKKWFNHRSYGFVQPSV